MKTLGIALAFILGALSTFYVGTAQAQQQQLLPLICGPVTSISVPGSNISNDATTGTEFGFTCNNGAANAVPITSTQNTDLPPAAFAMTAKCWGDNLITFVVQKKHPNWKEAYLIAQASYLGEKPLFVGTNAAMTNLLSTIAPECYNQADKKIVVFDAIQVGLWSPTP